MSDVERAIRDACADSTVDMVNLIRSPSGGWQVSIKRAYRGHNVHHNADPVLALIAALTAPALAPVVVKPPVVAPTAAATIDPDLFG